MASPSTIFELTLAGHGNASAIGAPGASSMTYTDLDAQIRIAAGVLKGLGINRNSRVAIVLPNGPEMATCFLSVTATATAAPLNPGYRAQEFEFYLTDLKADAVIVAAQVDSPAAAVAHSLKIPVIELLARPDLGAGRFDLAAPGPELVGCAKSVEPDDIALILHTSGTTSRPKIVPLSQRNVATSALNIAATLHLSASDRALNIMPLFHIHGLIAGLLAPLSAGGFVGCTSGFNALKFFGWMEEMQPTWYTAVPTMHQAIVSRAGQNRRIIAKNPLRFIRSSSAAMPTKVIQELEDVFQTPVLEAYGMTEAAHQMCSNPLPPKLRKPGTVGIAAGPEVAIMDENWTMLGVDRAGEVVIRGDNVTAGYENNPKANVAAFRDGWFRTGDQGVIDADGYLTITGRLKELINRGGEKVSPREVDEILMAHPAVLQAVTFAIPHQKLGEEVGAAVILRDGAAATAQDIREFAEACLADFKVPRRIVFVDEIPKGPTGKLQRIGLAETLGVA